MFYIVNKNNGFQYLKEAIEELKKYENAILVKANEDILMKIGSVENGKARY